MKNLHRLFAAATVAVIGVTGVACKSATPYAAKVNGIVLSKAGLDAELEAFRKNKDYLDALRAEGTNIDGPNSTGTELNNTSTYNQSFVAQILTRRIYFELIRQELERRKLKVTNEDREIARDQLIGSMPGDGEKMFGDFPKAFQEEMLRTTAEVWVLQKALASTSESNLRAYYNDHKDQFESACAAHILVETKAKADSLVKQLNAARDKKATFADLASKNSQDPGSKENGGDLGCASPAGYVAEFKEAVRTQKIGVIGQPVQTQFGYHIIRVDSREAAKPFEEVREEVEAAVTDGQQGAFTQFIVEAATKADIEINPRYGTFDTSGQSPTVVPPEAPGAANG